MTFKKGKSGNPKGKPKGSISAKTKLWKHLESYMTKEGADKFKKELMKLEGKEFIDKYLQALEYFKPKLARQDGKQTHEISELERLLQEISSGNKSD